MPIYLRRLLLTSLAAGSVLYGHAASAADPAPANVSGTWAMTVTSKMGTNKPTAVLAQDGTHLTGTYKGRTGDTPLTGTVAGNHVQLDIPIRMMGRAMQLTYTGVVDGDMMSGTTKMAQMGEGAFTGKRQP